MDNAEKITKNNTKLQLNVALNYGSKVDIVFATKMIANKAIDHFKHKAEKVKTIREAELQACKEVDVQRIKSQDKSWKDEILMVWLIAMLSTGWFDETRDNFEEWVRIINNLPDSVWYLVIIVFTATFSTKMTDKVLNRNKKK